MLEEEKARGNKSI